MKIVILILKTLINCNHCFLFNLLRSIRLIILLNSSLLRILLIQYFKLYLFNLLWKLNNTIHNWNRLLLFNLAMSILLIIIILILSIKSRLIIWLILFLFIYLPFLFTNFNRNIISQVFFFLALFISFNSFMIANTMIYAFLFLFSLSSILYVMVYYLSSLSSIEETSYLWKTCCSCSLSLYARPLQLKLFEAALQNPNGILMWIDDDS